MSLLNVVACVAQRGGGRSWLHETIGFGLAAWLVRGLYFSVKYYTGWIAVALAVLMLLGAWRPTRRLARAAAAAVVVAASAWLAALACAFAFVFVPAAGAILPLVAILPALALARDGRRPAVVLLTVAVGVGVGLFGAQLTSLPFATIRPPLYGFVPPVLISLAVAWLVARYSTPDLVPFGRRLTRSWGVCAACLAAMTLVAVEAYHFRARPPQGPATRVVADWAYDVFVTGEPGSLVWTTRERAFVLADAYGEARARDTLDENLVMVERIWRSVHGDFYLQASRRIGWWNPVSGDAVPRIPATWLDEDHWFPDREAATTVSTFAEDPLSRRFVVFTEWLSQYALVEHDGRGVVANGKLSRAVWPWWYVTIDPAARIAVATSAFDDGGLYVFNVDTMGLLRQAAGLHLYETVLDGAGGALWGVRPLSGEVVAVDPQTLDLRTRIAVEVGLRDLQIDPVSGDLFTCSFLSGQIYRIDRETFAPSPLAWCGRLARNLYLDSRRRALWVATADGVCWIPIDP